MIKAVLFDIDGVLLDSFEANIAFFQALFVHFGYPKPKRKEFIPLSHMTMWNVIKAVTKLESEEEIKNIWEFGKKFSHKEHQLIKIPPNAEKIVDKLASLYQLGIVTSRVRENIYFIEFLAKLEKNFQITVAFEDTINHKPHPEPLLFASRELNIKPAEIVYVGDTESDGIAAKAAGMKFILFGKTAYLNVENHTYSFKELPRIISGLG